MSKHEFIPSSFPLYSNYKNIDEEREPYSLRVVGFDVEHKEDGTIFVTPLDIDQEGFIQEAGYHAIGYEVTFAETQEYK